MRYRYVRDVSMDAAVVALHEAAEKRLWLRFVAARFGARYGPTQSRWEAQRSHTEAITCAMHNGNDAVANMKVLFQNTIFLRRRSVWRGIHKPRQPLCKL
jgi:hypothetical protein